MTRYFGFDLGDAESAVCILDSENMSEPQVVPVAGSRSFITACARDLTGTVIIGEKACYQADVSSRSIRFKSSYITDPGSRAFVRLFASGVLNSLKKDGWLIDNDPDIENIFYIGCPAGWSPSIRESNRQLFESCGYPPLKIVSESRAAMISACQSRHLQVGYDILSKPVLVIDIGSSTTDYAFVSRGREEAMRTGGEVALGGGIMDHVLLQHAVDRCSPEERERILEIFRLSPSWKSYCEFAGRRLKEKYYQDPDFFQFNRCSDTVQIRYDAAPIYLTLEMSPEIADRLENYPTDILNGKSFRQVFTDSLKEVKIQLQERQPELVFLTGGVSKMPAVSDWCRSVFPDAVLIAGSEPEFSVARGLSWSGQIDANVKEFRQELKSIIDSPLVEDIVTDHLDDLFRKVTDVLVEPLIIHAAIPSYELWRNGSIPTLADTEKQMEKEITAFLRTDEARSLLSEAVSRWMRPVAAKLEESTIPICVRHHVPYSALSLRGSFAPSDVDIHIDARHVFAVDGMTFVIDTIVSLITALLCGGSGIALISSGPTGIVAGLSLSILVLLLGKDTMEKALMRVRIPSGLRRLAPKNILARRMEEITTAVRSSLSKSLVEDRSQQITENMVSEISQQIEQTLTRMAQVVEIPLG